MAQMKTWTALVSPDKHRPQHAAGRANIQVTVQADSYYSAKMQIEAIYGKDPFVGTLMEVKS